MSLLDPGLLKILCCPETHQPVSEADAALISVLNNRIAAGSVKNRGGKSARQQEAGKEVTPCVGSKSTGSAA